MSESAGPLRLRVSPWLRELMRYDKFARATPHLLVLQGGYWLESACLRAARHLGWKTALAPVVMEGTMPREMIAAFLERLTTFRPDFVLAVNLGGMDERGLFAGLFADLEIPYVTWFVDDPRTILMDRTCYVSPFAVACTWERAYQSYLEAAGFACTFFLPLAADIHLFQGAFDPAAFQPPSFVGSSMAGYAAREWPWLDARPRLANALREAFAAGRVGRESFGQGMQAIIGEKVWAACDAEERRHLELVCFIEGTRRLREALVRALAPEDLVVRGDNGWQDITPLAGPPVDYDRELPAWFRACTVNLNTTSLQMATAVNQRVFDCPAAGGFLLTDAQEDLGELFGPEEVETYASLEECREKIRYYRDHPAARGKVVAAAQTRILQEHTYEHRLQHLVSSLTLRFRAS
ncbi:MAG: glycosyltransferase [Candidatus Hydrogenedentes bacterium]|nr:glycosyltransferase [Candidatus Hydrogenedentota bacterium]